MVNETERSNLPVHSSPELYDHYTLEGVEVYDHMLIDRLVAEHRDLGKAHIKCLDLCTGTGQLLIKVASAPELREVSFAAFDLFEDMLQMARKNIAAAGLALRVDLQFADVHALPYVDSEFDMIMGRSIVHHWSHPVLAFREIYRVLRPGGVCVIHEPRRDPDQEAVAAANLDRQRVGVHPFQLEEKYTADEVRDQLREAGIVKFDVFAPSSGREALGFEIRMPKKKTASHG